MGLMVCVRSSNPVSPMSAAGQNPNPTLALTLPLPPAADRPIPHPRRWGDRPRPGVAPVPDNDCEVAKPVQFVVPREKELNVEGRELAGCSDERFPRCLIGSERGP